MTLAAGASSAGAALPAQLPKASAVPLETPKSVQPGDIITLRANIVNTGTSLGYAPFFEFAVPTSTDPNKCFEFQTGSQTWTFGPPNGPAIGTVSLNSCIHGIVMCPRCDRQ